jgi:hypothetical protein
VETPTVSLKAAIASLTPYRSVLPTVLMLTVVEFASSLTLPVRGWQFLLLAIAVLLFGYQVNVARAVFLGRTDLPSPVEAPASLLRRGFGVYVLVTVAVISVFAFYLAIGLGAGIVTDADWVLVVLLLVSGAFAAIVLALTLSLIARYVAFDTFREGVRLLAALRELRSHPAASVRLVGYLLVVQSILTVLQLWVLRLLGLSGAKAQAAAMAGLLHGAALPGVQLLALRIGFGIVLALWLLVSAHLMGQYSARVYGPEPELLSA